MQDNKQRAGHGAQGHEALGEVADALLDDVVGDANGFAFVGVVFVGDVAGDAESGCVERCLGDETVGEGNTQETGHEGGDSEQPEVPVEAGWLAQRELGSLGDKRRDYMVSQPSMFLS